MTRWPEANAYIQEHDDEHIPDVAATENRIRALECRVEDLESDIANAVKYAKEYEPDYPWSEGTASEVSWALGCSLQGTAAANNDLHRIFQLLIKSGKVTMGELLEYNRIARNEKT